MYEQENYFELISQIILVYKICNILLHNLLYLIINSEIWLNIMLLGFIL